MPSTCPRVLVVSRVSFVEPLLAPLRRESIAVEHVTSLDTVEAKAYDIVIVEADVADWRALRDQGTSVIVFAPRADCETITAALAAGADDVITRGDRPHETVARIRSLARRRPSSPAASAALRIADVELDPDRRRVVVRGDEVELTRTQFDLLEFFLRHPGRVHSRESLLKNVWDMAATQEVNAVEVQVRRLREAIGDDLRSPTRLRTIRGVGYLFER